MHQEIPFPTSLGVSERHAHFHIIITLVHLYGRNVLARHFARHIRRRRKHAPKTAAGETAQFVRVPPTRMQLRKYT